jgi:hypothetical protein
MAVSYSELLGGVERLEFLNIQERRIHFGVLAIPC